MTKVKTLKILIVGLTSVLSLSSFSKTDFKKDILGEIALNLKR
jgi:hypothetical protein